MTGFPFSYESKILSKSCSGTAFLPKISGLDV
jgi:hypothetical protein